MVEVISVTGEGFVTTAFCCVVERAPTGRIPSARRAVGKARLPAAAGIRGEVLLEGNWWGRGNVRTPSVSGCGTGSEYAVSPIGIFRSQ